MAAIAALAISNVAFSQPVPHPALRIYFVDVEGGHATLFVIPAGQSLLLDAGSAGRRDPDRIVAAAREAGIARLDYVLITRFHSDHVGGAPELAKRIPIGTFINHAGGNREGPESVSDAV